MTDQSAPGSGEQKFVKTIRDDFRRGNFRRTIRRDFEELKEFMLDDERKKRLAGMGRLRRGMVVCWWLFKSMFFKLTPARRILLLIGVVSLWSIHTRTDGTSVSVDVTFLGGVLLLFVLMLELKDKLVARKELEAGRAVQEALLPPRSPRVPGWSLWLFSRSANEVGGDLVDFVQVSENRFGVAVGDVAGKGLRAALLTSKLQSSLRALVTEFSPLGELATKLNQIFCRDSLPNLFASMVYIELQPGSGAVRFVNAGHIPPLVIRGPNVSKVGKGGPALGIMREATFAEQRAELDEKNLFLVYSDGLTEAQNEQGDFFGEQRLLDILPELVDLPPVQLGERLVAEVDRFIGDRRPNDDLSIALLKRGTIQ